MNVKANRLEDRVLEGSFIDQLESLPTDDLRERRAQALELETELSYTRRLLQGKVDILKHELERRASGGDSGIESIRKRLPAILADDAGEARESGMSGLGRFPNVAIPRNAERQRRELEVVASEAVLANICELETEELSELADRLAAVEESASATRRRVLEVVDALQAELVRRYREGQEDPTALLSK